uniref:[RNA-polymerase]-subunit kinase n=2 Tax=Lygus hesperus TaxID=30085 RepID=A0A0A9WLW6_LYGHE
MYLRDSTIGFSMESVRELKLLQEIHHPNIISVYHVYIRHDNLCMVMECLPNDLEKFINNANIILTQSHIKCIMMMILKGVAKLHEMYIMHRDLKPSNILIAEDGTLRIADFGGAKFAGSPNRKFSPQACTLWYRAPELLFGSKYYGPQSDMWSVGCIFGEILLRTPLFMGESTDITQLEKIFSILGPATEQDWPGVRIAHMLCAALPLHRCLYIYTQVSSLPGYIAFSAPVPFRPLEADLHASPKSAVNLLLRILQKNPRKRISAAEALLDPYFTESPLPCLPSDLPGING